LEVERAVDICDKHPAKTKKADPPPRDDSSLMGAGIRDDRFGQVRSEPGCQHSQLEGREVARFRREET